MAVVLREEMAVQIYNILNTQKKPVYFWNDIINENLNGYRFFGRYPSEMRIR